jgi:enoyl-CoA hydratase/carnithine racemase
MRGIDLDVTGACATVTLDRPLTKNAITEEMFLDLGAAFRQLAADRAVRVVIVTGANGNFSSGGDVSGGAAPAAGGARAMAPVNEAARALHDLPQPTIAKVDGVAVGAGMNLALGCDLVVASTRARFSEIFARVAQSPDFGGSWLLPRVVGLQKAKELVFLGDIISAAEAARIGFVNRVVPVEELDAAVAAWADQLAEGPQIALAAAKQMLNSAHHQPYADALVAEARSQALNWVTRDAAEAGQAWKERRQPRFNGS